MLELVRDAVRPALRLQDCVENWPTIAHKLCEPPRKRQPQREKLVEKCPILS